MEYIRDMLLRQREVLARLMLGGAADTPDASAAPEAARWDGGVPAKGGTAPGGAVSGGREVRRTQRRETALWPGLSGPEGETLRQALARKSAERQRALASGLADAEGIARALPAARRGSAGGDGRSPGGTGTARPVGDGGTETADVLLEVRQRGAADAGADAKALSRAFQRDARRYDGGFRLYE